jgi:hypothetical protein
MKPYVLLSHSCMRAPCRSAHATEPAASKAVHSMLQPARLRAADTDGMCSASSRNTGTACVHTPHRALCGALAMPREQTELSVRTKMTG